MDIENNWPEQIWLYQDQNGRTGFTSIDDPGGLRQKYVRSDPDSRPGPRPEFCRDCRYHWAGKDGKGREECCAAIVPEERSGDCPTCPIGEILAAASIAEPEPGKEGGA